MDLTESGFVDRSFMRVEMRRCVRSATVYTVGRFPLLKYNNDILSNSHLAAASYTSKELFAG